MNRENAEKNKENDSENTKEIRESNLKCFLFGALIGFFIAGLVILGQVADVGVHFKDVPDSAIITAYGKNFDPPEVTAYFGGTSLIPAVFPAEVRQDGTADTGKIGTCTLHYTAAFLWMKAEAECTVYVRDLDAPVISLNEGNAVAVDQNSEWTDPGYRAEDNVDGDVTAQVKVSGEVDTSAAGTCELTYTVIDIAGNQASANRTVTINDKEAPLLTLSGEESVVVKQGEEWNDPGCAAEDNLDGSLEVKTDGRVDTAKAGVYKITYTAADAAGNENQIVRTVYVTGKTTEVNETDPGDKVVYLTFDDGPGKYTRELLDVLDKYNVKVTFFVTNQFSGYQDMIRKEYEAGHTVAIHSYTHDFAQIYTGEQNFYNDIEKMAEVCKKQTGVTPTILRFPGGTSNTVSRKYCSGIMTALTQSCEVMGYRYCDWNVDSNDAGGATTSSEVAANVIAGLKSHNVSYVLQHDIKKFSVGAVEEIIQWGLANGYTFLPLTDSSPMCHHRANN